jgi:hypothetical protein
VFFAACVITQIWIEIKEISLFSSEEYNDSNEDYKDAIEEKND